MQKYYDLQIYKRAINLIVDLYKFTKELPQSENFGLKSQIQRAGVSIALNIAEGCGTSSNKDFVNFLRISLKSTYELKAALEVCYKLKYCTKNRIIKLYQELDEIGAMINGLIKKLK